MGEEIGQVLGRLLRPFFQAVFRNLSNEQQSALIYRICVSLLIFATGYIVITCYKHRRRFKDKFSTFYNETRSAFIAAFRELRVMPKPAVSRSHKLSLLVPTALLMLAALTSWPYNFYVVLRWVVCGVAIYTITAFNRRRFFLWTALFGIIAFLFNPISRLHLDRDIWVWVNLISATGFIAFASLAKSS